MSDSEDNMESSAPLSSSAPVSVAGSPLVCALIVKEATAVSPMLCALATFNRSTKKIQIAEYSDSPQLPITESLILQLDDPPSELCAFVNNNQGLAKCVVNLVTSCAVQFLHSLQTFDEGCVSSDIGRLLPMSSNASSLWVFNLVGSELSKCVFSTLISQYRILSNRDNFNKCDIEKLSTEGVYMRLDRATFNALNLFDNDPSGGLSNTALFKATTTTSLFGLLNKCKTRMGSRRLRQWLRQPLVDSRKISERHEVVQALVGNARLRHTIQANRLSRVPDLDLIKGKLGKVTGESVNNKSGGQLTLEDLVKVYEGIVSASGLVEDLAILESNPTNGDSISSISSLVLDPLRKAVSQMEGFLRLIEATLDLDAVTSENTYRIHPKFDPALFELGSERDRIQKEMDKLVYQVCRKSGVDNVKVADCIQSYGMAFRVPRKAMSVIQALGSKFKQVQLNKGEYFFTTSELIDLVAEMDSVEKSYRKKSQVVLQKIINVASSYYTVLGELADLIGQLDVLNAFAVAAATYRLRRPQIGENSGRLNLINCRHLLVEIKAAENGAADYIPNSICMEPASNMQIITGPNMGGKSTYIRSVALCVLMNQIGCFVPCDEGSELPLFKSLMCRVGASDAQVRGISTFMQEMIEAACIVNSANESSLVIIDELGRGTSTQDGFGLAWAISSYLKNTARSFVLFATHFHELANLPGVKNRHVAALVDENKLTLLYEVRDGPSSSSFGTNVAELAGYPEVVIHNAIEREKRMALDRLGEEPRVSMDM